MKLKRLISCGLVGILTGVGILMNAKVSSAEDKSVKYTIASSASVTASGQVIEGSNASFKNTYSTKEQITKDNSMTFKLTNIDGIKVSKIVMKTHTNKSKGAGTIKIDIGEGNLYSGNYIKSFSTSYSDYEFDVKALKNVDYMFGDISIVMSCTVNSLYCQSYTIDNVSLRFGVNLTEEMKSLEGVKFGAILAKKVDVANINLSEYARECTSAAEVVAGDPNLKYLEFTNIASEGGMTSIRIDDIGASYDTKIVVVIYMEYNGKLYLTEATIGSFKSIASEYLNLNLDLSQDVINSLTQIVK